MAASAGLLNWIKSRQNTLAAVKPAVPSLLNLKQSVQGVPFQLLEKGMSGVMTGGNIMAGLQSMASSFGGLGSIPGLQSILGQVTNGTADVASLQSVLGGGAFAAAMASYAGGADSNTTTPISNTSNQFLTSANAAIVGNLVVDMAVANTPVPFAGPFVLDPNANGFAFYDSLVDENYGDT